MQGKRIKAVATAKRHTVVLTVEGDIYTWGHRVVTPKRVLLSGQSSHIACLLLLLSVSRW